MTEEKTGKTSDVRARVDDETKARLEALASRTGRTVSDLLVSGALAFEDPPWFRAGAKVKTNRGGGGVIVAVSTTDPGMAVVRFRTGEAYLHRSQLLPARGGGS